MHNQRAWVTLCSAVSVQSECKTEENISRRRGNDVGNSSAARSSPGGLISAATHFFMALTMMLTEQTLKSSHSFFISLHRSPCSFMCCYLRFYFNFSSSGSQTWFDWSGDHSTLSKSELQRGESLRPNGSEHMLVMKTLITSTRVSALTLLFLLSLPEVCVWFEVRVEPLCLCRFHLPFFIVWTRDPAD